MNDFTAAEFMDGRNPRTEANRESCCGFCRYRRKHKCAKYDGRIVNAPCDPIAEYMRQGGRGMLSIFNVNIELKKVSKNDYD